MNYSFNFFIIYIIYVNFCLLYYCILFIFKISYIVFFVFLNYCDFSYFYNNFNLSLHYLFIIFILSLFFFYYIYITLLILSLCMFNCESKLFPHSINVFFIYILKFVIKLSNANVLFSIIVFTASIY